MYNMSTSVDCMKFKDMKSAVDFAHKEWYSKLPRYMVEQYIYFGDKYPEVMEKVMSGLALTKEEQKLIEAGEEYKKTFYADNEVIEDAMEIRCDADATPEVIKDIFKGEGEEKGENINLDEVPFPSNQNKIKEIMEEEANKDGAQ